MTRTMTGLLVVTLAVLAPAKASALGEGEEGNEPLQVADWPKGAAVIFNHVGRIAWWDHSGDWHSDCRGDAKALTAVLADFAKLDVKTKRIVVHDGIGYSYFLTLDEEPDKLEAAKIDWVFMVWSTPSWEQLRKRLGDDPPTEFGDTSPPSQIDVYTANIRWSDVTVPAGITVVDQRLEAHGFTAADGAVIEGRVTDLSTGQPIVATMRLERIEQQKKGDARYPVIAQSKADAEGRWVLKHVPPGAVRPEYGRDLYRMVVEADGFVPRVAGYGQFDGQAQWRSYDTGLAPPASVSGRVMDASGKPLADVKVSFDDVRPESGGSYESPLEPEYTFKTDAAGRFRADQLPAGKATIWLRKPGYCRPGRGLPITTPKGDVELQMLKAGSICVTVDFAGKKPPEGYMVELEPKGGNVVGSYGGVAPIDRKNQFTFPDVPPGEYVLKGHPNPYRPDQTSETVAIDLKGGDAADVTLQAK